jgi:hypothetical protein
MRANNGFVLAPTLFFLSNDDFEWLGLKNGLLEPDGDTFNMSFGVKSECLRQIKT